MKYIKEHIMLIVFLFLGLVVFVTLAILSSGISDDIQQVSTDIQREWSNQTFTQEELSSFQNLDSDSELSLLELSSLANVEKKQSIFWKNILNSRENHMSKWSKKSAESVNADITRLFTSLRSRCLSAEIELPVSSSKSPTIGFGDTSKKPENNYGFGFSAYDGFWPSFSEEEAKILGVQAKIVKEMVEFITQSTIESQKLTIVQILREAAGKIDLTHIENDQLTIGVEQQLLLREEGKLSSLVFLITIKGQSKHARNFMNKLRPPFMLRNLTVRRDLVEAEPSRVVNDFTPNPFGESGEDFTPSKKESFPIVKDVNSEFSFLIEYITEINNGVEQLFTNNSIWEKGDPEVLEQFFSISGNTDKIEEAKLLIRNSE